MDAFPFAGTVNFRRAGQCLVESSPAKAASFLAQVDVGLSGILNLPLRVTRDVIDRQVYQLLEAQRGQAIGRLGSGVRVRRTGSKA